jgi:hypothetical protein
MCQCIFCDCLWLNCFGVCCAGIHNALFCASCWIAMPEDLAKLNANCCHILEWTGYGSNCFCTGGVFCAPSYIKDWSKAHAAAKK